MGSVFTQLPTPLFPHQKLNLQYTILLLNSQWLVPFELTQKIKKINAKTLRGKAITP